MTYQMAAQGSSRGLALPLLMLSALGMARAEEEGSGDGQTMSLGLLMMAAVFMMMGIVYLTHMGDHDIRKITWSTLNNTVSIFCAVIMYKNVSELVDILYHMGTVGDQLTAFTLSHKIAMNRVYTVLWYTLLCVAIFIWCGGLSQGKAWRKAVLEKKGVKAVVHGEDLQSPSFEQTQTRMKCCLFLAHTTGFAGLAGWGMRMNTDWYKDSPWRCALLIPLAAFWYSTLIVLVSLARRCILNPRSVPFRFVHRLSFVQLVDGKKPDKLLELAEEQVEDGENDFFGLFMSFLCVSTIRFFVGGNLPNEEGEEGELVFKHTRMQASVMLLVSVCLFFSAMGILRLKDQIMRRRLAELAEEKAAKEGESKEEAEEEEEDETREEKELKVWERFAGKCWYLVLGDRFSGKLRVFLESESARILARIFEMLVNTTSFSFAWCFMYGMQWFLAPFFEGQELELGIVLAIVTTLCSCVLVYRLDHEADTWETKSVKRKTKEKEVLESFDAREFRTEDMVEDEDVVCRKLMASTGILIGFVWEQCFDVAVAGMAGDGGNLWLKPLFAILTVGVMMPVWLWYIVPMETSEGYILGFTPRMVYWRLQKLDFDAEPNMKRHVKEHVEAFLFVVKKKNPGLLQEIMEDQAWETSPSASYQPPTSAFSTRPATEPAY